MKTFKIQKLAEIQELAPGLQRLLEDTWPDYYGSKGPGDAALEAQKGCQESGLPVIFVASSGGSVLATVALKETSIPTHAHLTPWLAGLATSSGARRQGIGEALVGALEDEAKSQGFSKIYSATYTAKGILERRGWARIDEQIEDGEIYGIYIKKL